MITKHFYTKRSDANKAAKALRKAGATVKLKNEKDIFVLIADGIDFQPAIKIADSVKQQ